MPSRKFVSHRLCLNHHLTVYATLRIADGLEGRVDTLLSELDAVLQGLETSQQPKQDTQKTKEPDQNLESATSGNDSGS